MLNILLQAITTRAIEEDLPELGREEQMRTGIARFIGLTVMMGGASAAGLRLSGIL